MRAGRCTLVEGLWLMVIGMTTVFAFLGMLVLTMQGSAAFFTAYGHLFPEPADPAPRALPSDAPSPEIAVVLAAIAQHRRS